MYRAAVLAACLFLSVTPSEGQSYLVAPLQNRSAASNLDWIGESVAESLRAAMDSSDLPVLSREEREEGIKRLSLRPGAPMSFASWTKLTESLSADFLIHGQFEFLPAPGSGATDKVSVPPATAPANGGGAGDPAPLMHTTPKGQLRIDVRVFDRRHVLQTTEIIERGPIEDLALLETLVAYRLVKFLAKDFRLSREEFDRRHPPVKLTAKEYYIRGLMASTKEARHRYFAQAVLLEPSFAQPCFYLGLMQWDNNNYRVAAGWLERITPFQDHYWDAQFYLGLSRYQSANFDGALEAFRKLVSRYPVPEVMNNLGAVELALDMPEALGHFKAALDKDASDPDYHFNVAYALWRAGEYEAAAQKFRAVLDRVNDDQDAILLLGRSLKQSGPRQGEVRTEGLERLKEELDLSEFRDARHAAK